MLCIIMDIKLMIMYEINDYAIYTIGLLNLIQRCCANSFIYYQIYMI